MLPLLVAAAVSVPASEQAAIFTAAGFTRRADKWRTDCDDASTPGYGPGAIETYRDLNADGRPEAVVTDGGTFCYGSTENGFYLLTRQSNGRWSKIFQSQGIAEFLKTRGVAKMPDISIGGPGFCFLVVRWNGKAYVKNRFEYAGKPCRPPR
jgi:hypothetical protein